MKRRDFLVQSALAAAGLSGLPACAPGSRGTGAVVPGARIATGAASAGDALVRELAMLALDSARAAGAEYADVRISRNRNQAVSTRERQITGLIDNETFGFGVRVLASGSWGFAASRELSGEDVQRVAREAVVQARANAVARERPVVLAPVETYPDAAWRSPIRIDPFSVPVEDKVALLLAANAAALGVKGARFVNSSMFFVQEDKTFASTAGTFSTQTIFRSLPRMQITAVSPDGSDFQTRVSTDVQPRGLG